MFRDDAKPALAKGQSAASERIIHLWVQVIQDFRRESALPPGEPQHRLLQSGRLS